MVLRVQEASKLEDLTSLVSPSRKTESSNQQESSSQYIDETAKCLFPNGDFFHITLHQASKFSIFQLRLLAVPTPQPKACFVSNDPLQFIFFVI